MPKELKTGEEFAKLLPTATEVRVKKDGDSAKVKARTPTGLYTLKTTTEQVDSLVKGVKVPVTEY